MSVNHTLPGAFSFEILVQHHFRAASEILGLGIKQKQTLTNRLKHHNAIFGEDYF